MVTLEERRGGDRWTHTYDECSIAEEKRNGINPARVKQFKYYTVLGLPQ